MAQAAPTGLDVTELKFKLQSKVPIFKGDGNAKDGCSLLAAASVHGIVFAGTNRPELRVLRLQDITTDRVINEVVPLRTVPLPSEPYQLAVSCDHGFLAVDVVANGVPFVYIYSVPSFLSGSVVKLHEIKTSSQPGVRSTQLCWNPVMHNVLSVRTEIGGLSVYTLKEPAGMEFHSLDANSTERAQCACWSPKGKQLVVAFANGKLMQYKPDLKPARSIVCPPGVMEDGGGFDVLAIQWLSTYQFAAVFQPNAADSVPALYVINAPKVGNPVLINYEDVCYSQSGPRKGQIFLQHILPWNLLLVASANSMEVGMLGTTETGEAPTWCQWTTTDEARAELPLTVDKQETFPVGIALETGCTHQLVISEQTFPVMPMVHLLSTYGQLVSFNVLNTLPNVPNICSPPKPLQDMSGGAFVKIDFGISGSTNSNAPQPVMAGAVAAPAVTSSTAALPSSELSFAVPTGATSTPAIAGKTKSLFATGGNENAVQKSPISLFGTTTVIGQQPQQQKPPAASIAPTFGKQITFGTQPTAGESKVSPFATFAPSSGGFGTTAGGLPTMSAPPFQAAMASMAPPTATVQSLPSTLVTGADANKPLVTVPPTYVPATTGQQQQPTYQQNPAGLSRAQKKPDVSSEDNNAIIRALTIDELKRFTRELSDLQQRNRAVSVHIGEKEESVQIIRSLRELEDIIAQANESTQSLIADVQALRLGLNEAFAMVAEANSKSAIFSNPSVQQYHEVHGMSQTSRRQLTALENMLQVNETQLRTVMKQLDAQWMAVEEVKQTRARQRMHIPSLEVLYQTLSKQQDILNRQGEKLVYLKSKVGLRSNLKGLDEREKVGPGQVRPDNSSESAIESLTDSIISMTIGEQVAADTRKLNEAKMAALKKALVGRRVVKLTPQRPDRIGLSSEVVRERRDAARRFDLEQEQTKKQQAALQASVAKKETDQKKLQQQQRALQQQRPASQPAVSKPLGPSTTSNKAFSFANPQSSSVAATVVATTAPTTSATITMPTVGIGSFSFGQTTITPFSTVEPAMKPTANGGSISTGLSYAVSATKENGKGEKKDTIPIGTGKENEPSSPAPTLAKSSSSMFNFGSATGNVTTAAFKAAAPAEVSSTTGPKTVFSFGGTPGGANNAPVLSFGTVPKTNFSFDPPASTTPSTMGNGSGLSFASGATADAPFNLTKAKPATISLPSVGSNDKLPPVDDPQKDKPLPPSFGPVEGTPSTKSPLPALTSLLQKVDPSVDVVTVTKTVSPQTKPGAGIFGSVTGGTVGSFGSGAGGLFGSVGKPGTVVEDGSKAVTGGGLFSGLSFGSGSGANETNATSGGSIFGSVKPATNAANGAGTVPASSVGLTFGSSNFATSGFGSAKAPALMTATSTGAITTSTTAVAATAATSTPASTISASEPTKVDVKPEPSTGAGSIGLGTSSTIVSSAAASTTATAGVPSTGAFSFGSLSFGKPLTTVASPSTVSSVVVPTTTTTGLDTPITSTIATTVTSSADVTSGLFGSISICSPNSTATKLSSNTGGGNIFGTSSFGSPKPNDTTSIFGGGGGSISSGSIFEAAKPPTTGPFGDAVSTAATISTAATPVGGGLFGSVSQPSIGAAANTTTAAVPSGGNIFGGFFGGATTAAATSTTTASSGGGSFFGSGVGTTNSSVFGASSPGTTPSIFGGSTAPASSSSGGGLFGSVAPNANVSAGGGGSIFGGTSAFGTAAVVGGNSSSGSNIFGSPVAPATAAGTGLFGSVVPTASSAPFGSPQSPGQQPGVGTQSIFGGGGAAATGGFGSVGAANPGPFSSGGAVNAFASPTTAGGSAFSKPPAFGVASTFGGAPAFGGGAHTFGGAPSFGGAPAFGSPKGAFGGAPAFGGGGSPVVGSPTQSNNLFEQLGSSSAGVSFGGLAQQQAAKPTQFGGSSFSSWRS